MPRSCSELLGIGRVEHARDLHHAVQNLAVVHPHDVVAARDADLFQRVGQHGADLGVGGDGGGADGVGIALIELAEAARSRLFVAPDGAHRVAAVGAGQVVAELGGDAGERCGQVVAQGEPVLILVLPGEDALVRAVDIGQELAQGLDRLDRARLQRVEAVAFVDPRDGVEHGFAFGHIRAEIVAEALRRFGLGPAWRILSSAMVRDLPAVAGSSIGWRPAGKAAAWRGGAAMRGSLARAPGRRTAA